MVRVLLLVHLMVASCLRVPTMSASGSKGKLLVIGGNGFVGREVCKAAVQAGFQVTSLSRRGTNPDAGDADLAQVTWNAGNALDKGTVTKYVNDADAVVHCIGLLFDAKSGITWANNIVSGSRAAVDPEESTYDNITRRSALMVLEALKAKNMLPAMMGKRVPMGFVSCAESGWPDVPYGDKVEAVAPEWLQRYLVAKRAVEAELMSTSNTAVRPIIVRPSLIWNWQKLDVLPLIPVFNIASAVGVPFVDKTVRVETVGKSLVAGLLDEQVSGVQRFMAMEELAARA